MVSHQIGAAARPAVNARQHWQARKQQPSPVVQEVPVVVAARKQIPFEVLCRCSRHELQLPGLEKRTHEADDENQMGVEFVSILICDTALVC